MKSSAHKNLLVAGIGFGAMAVAAPPALADVYAPDGGARAWQNGTHTTLSVEDSAADGNSVKAQWNSTSNELRNDSGNGTVAKKYNLNINAIRVCTIKGPIQPDSCSNWGQ